MTMRPADTKKLETLNHSSVFDFSKNGMNPHKTIRLTPSNRDTKRGDLSLEVNDPSSNR